ncbi:ParA family protein [Cellulomonas bogoriensis]|uniref:Cobyrinic acid a,c-diamide synthase n=1 Tax=Cellulomonas bogoriensis 69B4 = DSM 16987 TaxID=1386082 RepID=A0A0A0BZ65_9CELL|nr:ParA family protein [Cellulomonas bogoriensis]KGM13002.1 cobyrinic acid a,c-diamide synthase [Cellulomonas bogoriensis 69B4 = DSM 16987]
MKVVAVFSVKGGVGKTSAAVNLAWSSSREQRTVLWDLDPQGGATYLLGLTPKQKAKADIHALVKGKTDLVDVVRSTGDGALDVIPAHDSYSALDLELDATKRPERQLDKLLGSLKKHDVAVLDCPPGMSLLSDAILRAADVVVAPLVPSPLTMRSLDQVTDMVAGMKKKRPTVVGFLSMVDRRKTIHRDLAQTLPQESEHVIDVVVPASTTVERMGVERAPIATFAPRSAPTRAYGELWTGVRSALSLPRPGSGVEA